MDVDSDMSFVQAERGQHDPNTVHFYYHPVLNPHKTAEQGVEIHEDKEYLLIISPGQRLSEVRRKATDLDKMKYARQYEAFLKGKAQPIVGTPIASLPGLTPARVKELQYLHIHTVQQLIDVPDTALARIGPDALKLKNQARAFLEKNDVRVLELEQKIQELSAMVLQLTKAQPTQQPVKRKGRPPKKVNGDSTLHSTVSL